jgi:hypothetical protein
VTGSLKERLYGRATWQIEGGRLWECDLTDSSRETYLTWQIEEEKLTEGDLADRRRETKKGRLGRLKEGDCGSVTWQMKELDGGCVT